MSRQLVQQFKVGAIIWDVYADERLLTEHGALGICDYLNTEIRLDAGQEEQRMQQTLVHELLHAMFFEAGYDADEQDEDLVNRVGIVLHQFLADNFMNESESADIADGIHKHPVGFDTSATSVGESDNDEEGGGDSVV